VVGEIASESVGWDLGVHESRFSFCLADQIAELDAEGRCRALATSIPTLTLPSSIELIEVRCTFSSNRGR
jgi:hypothetical protein